VPKAFEFGESFSKPAKLALTGFQSGGRRAASLSKDNFFFINMLGRFKNRRVGSWPVFKSSQCNS
jgi:hypothetical protein